MKHEIVSLLGGASYKLDIWNWQFEQNPYDLAFDPVIVQKEGRIIGFNGVMPTQVRYQGNEIPVLWSCDFYVDSSIRGQGLGKFIKEELIKKNPLIMSFGISPMAAHVLLKMGWLSSPEVFTYKKVTRPSSLRHALFMILQVVNRLRGFFRLREQGLTIQYSESLPAAQQVDRLWGEVKGQYTKVVCRTWRYLDWKYQRHPTAKYNFLTVLDDTGLRALGVVRMHGGVARIVDYLGPNDSRVQQAFVRAFVMRFPDAHSYTCTTSGCEFGKALLSCGFFKARTQPRFFVRSEIPGDRNPELGWFLMGGDSDGELLLAASEAAGATLPGQH